MPLQPRNPDRGPDPEIQDHESQGTQELMGGEEAGMAWPSPSLPLPPFPGRPRRLGTPDPRLVIRSL